ncbi:MAG: hypothetical protein EZS28_051211, partial [Streblomastix strix]
MHTKRSSPKISKVVDDLVVLLKLNMYIASYFFEKYRSKLSGEAIEFVALDLLNELGF